MEKRQPMVLVAPVDRSRSRPFRILDGESETGPRLGGRAPLGIGDGLLQSDARYVLTVPLALAPEIELSVFVQRDLWEAMNRGILSDKRVVAVAHAPSPRRSDRRYASVLSEHRVVLGDEAPDLVTDQSDDGGPRPMSDHKIGGRPYCIQEPELEGAEALLDRGLLQLVQLVRRLVPAEL